MNNIPLHKYLPEKEMNSPIRVISLDGSTGYDSAVPHRHGYYELFFFNSGGGSHSIDFEENQIKANSIHSVSPGQVHTLNRGDGCVGKFIVFSAEAFLENDMDRKLLVEYPFLNNNSSIKVFELSDELFKELYTMVSNLEKELGNQSISRTWLHLILAYIKREFDNNFLDQEAFVKNAEFRAFKLLLEDNFAEQHSASWYADKLNLTQNTLNNLIKSSTGQTISKLINDRILLEAKRMILHSDVSIKEIAYDLGFQDPAYFTRFIKKQTDKSPVELRRNTEK
jgi:AraC family transcriptional activator of pobA